MTHFKAIKSFTGEHFFLVKDDFFKALYFGLDVNKFKAQFYKKYILPHKWDSFGTDSMRSVTNPL